jgi:hypothetical protein
MRVLTFLCICINFIFYLLFSRKINSVQIKEKKKIKTNKKNNLDLQLIYIYYHY